MKILDNMENEKIIFKVCTCCKQRKSEENFRRLNRKEGKGAERITWTSSVCKVCESKKLTKAQRIEVLRAARQRYNANARKREEKERERMFLLEESEFGL